MQSYVVLRNVMDGLFVTPVKYLKFHNPVTNPRVDLLIENEILLAFNAQSLQPVNTAVLKADTPKYIFIQFIEDIEEQMYWVEEKEVDIQSI